MVEESRNMPDAVSNPVRGIAIFCFIFLFHLGYPLIQLKVTKSYEIAVPGSPES